MRAPNRERLLADLNGALSGLGLLVHDARFTSGDMGEYAAYVFVVQVRVRVRVRVRARVRVRVRVRAQPSGFSSCCRSRPAVLHDSLRVRVRALRPHGHGAPQPPLRVALVAGL